MDTPGSGVTLMAPASEVAATGQSFVSSSTAPDRDDPVTIADQDWAFTASAALSEAQAPLGHDQLTNEAPAAVLEARAPSPGHHHPAPMTSAVPLGTQGSSTGNHLAFTDPATPTSVPQPFKIATFDALRSTHLGTDDKAAKYHAYKRDMPIAPTPGELIQAVALQAQKEHWIRELYNAIVDTNNIGDNVNSEAYKLFVDQSTPAYDPDDVLVGCACIWDEFISGAKKGWRRPFAQTAQMKKAIIASKRSKKETGDLYSRLKKILEALRREKTICVSVIELDLTQIRSLILAPTESMEIKERVRVLNNKRGRKNIEKQSATTGGKGKSNGAAASLGSAASKAKSAAGSSETAASKARSAAGPSGTAAFSLPTTTQQHQSNVSYAGQSAQLQTVAPSLLAPGIQHDQLDGSPRLSSSQSPIGAPWERTSRMPRLKPGMQQTRYISTQGFVPVLPFQTGEEMGTLMYGQPQISSGPLPRKRGRDEDDVGDASESSRRTKVSRSDGDTTSFPFPEPNLLLPGLATNIPLNRRPRAGNILRNDTSFQTRHSSIYAPAGTEFGELSYDSPHSGDFFGGEATSPFGYSPIYAPAGTDLGEFPNNVPHPGNVLGNETSFQTNDSPHYAPAGMNHAEFPNDGLRPSNFLGSEATSHFGDSPIYAPARTHPAEIQIAPEVHPIYAPRLTMPTYAPFDHFDVLIDPSIEPPLDQPLPQINHTARRS